MKYADAPKAIAAWNAIQPHSDRDREHLSRKFTVDFNFNSNYIEGNTLTYGQTELLLLFGKVVGEAEMKDLEEMKASGSSSELRTMPRSFALCSPSHLSLSTVCVSSSASTSRPYSACSPASKRKATSRHGTTKVAGACSLRHPSNAFASGFYSPDMHFFVPDLNLN